MDLVTSEEYHPMATFLMGGWRRYLTWLYDERATFGGL